MTKFPDYDDSQSFHYSENFFHLAITKAKTTTF